MIVEKGVHQLIDGTWLEAGKSTADKYWGKVYYTHKFA